MTQLRSRPSTIVAILGLMLQGCGAASGDLVALGQSEHAVTNPAECREDASPAAVVLLGTGSWQDPAGATLEGSYPSCSGALIAPDVVLTAAHCMGHGQLYVSFSQDVSNWETPFLENKPLPPDVVPVTQAFTHPAFGPFHDDLALLILSWPQDVPPELLLTGEEGVQLVSGMPIEFMGWGQTNSSRMTAGRRNCGYETVETVTSDEVSIGVSAASHLCYGDSGGPEFIHIETPSPVKRRLVAVNSHISNTNCVDASGWSSRVDTPTHADWIDKTLQDACANGQRTWCKIPGILPACYFDEKPCLPEEPEEGGGCSVVGAEGIAALLMAIVVRRKGRNSRPADHRRV